MYKYSNSMQKNSSSIRSEIPLTLAQIERVVPSIFATEKHIDRSDRYECIATINVLEALQKEGFEPFMVCQTKPKDESRYNFAKHMIRMRHQADITAAEANEIILINSADGTSSYQMLAGCFRFVCQNGHVAGDIVEDLRIRHTGNIIDNVVEGSYRILEQFDQVADSRDTMKAIDLNPYEQIAFAQSALALKYDDIKLAPIQPVQLLEVQRTADRENDLWSTFNRVQEHLVTGGVRGRSANGRRSTTRGINSISDNVKLNKALWTLADMMASLKQEPLAMAG